MGRSFEESLTQADRGEFATDEQVRAIWAKIRPVNLRDIPRAAAELTEILGYIEDRSPQGARHAQAQIQAIISLLSQHPHAGQRTSNDRLRRIVATPLIFYEVTEHEIVVHGVRRAARRPSKPE